MQFKNAAVNKCVFIFGMIPRTLIRLLVAANTFMVQINRSVTPRVQQVLQFRLQLLQ